MLILGISALDNNACATLLEDGRVLGAVAEERLSRVKMQAGFPRRAIAALLEMSGRRTRDIDAVAYPFFRWTDEGRRIAASLARNLAWEARAPSSIAQKLRHQVRYQRWAAQSVREHRRYTRELESELEAMGLSDRLQRVEHHLAHHASAFYCSPYERALIVSFDWYGGGLAGAIALGEGREIRRLHAFDYPHSLGLFYAQVTSALGFRVSRHEGKIVGLAAYGDPAVLGDRVRARFSVADGNLRYASAMDDRFAHGLARDHSREDVAAAWQSVLEAVATEVVGHYVRAHGVTNIVLAGGVTANVKMNQRLFEIPGVRGLYVHPAMGDDGTGTGAALWAAQQQGALPDDFQLGDVYLGPGYDEAAIAAALARAGVKARRYADVESAIARRLANGQVVARFDGRMEYGPRALGNRSILYHCQDPAVNAWLNEHLKRTEFMPFAPATLWEARHECFVGIDGAETAAEFMTVTFDCTDHFRRTCPAATHVDGTARPQLVRRETNPSFHRVIERYRALTGHASIINTSFNMHEEPIVCTPDDAIRAWQQGHLDHLAIGPFIASHDRLAR